MASRLLGSVEAKSSSLKENKSEDPMVKQPLILPDTLPFWRNLVGFVAIGLCSSTDDTLVHFLHTARTNSRAVSLRD